MTEPYFDFPLPPPLTAHDSRVWVFAPVVRGVLDNFAFNMAPFCIYFGFVAPSFSSFSKMFFFLLLTFLAGYLTTCHERWCPFAAYAALQEAALLLYLQLGGSPFPVRRFLCMEGKACLFSIVRKPCSHAYRVPRDLAPVIPRSSVGSRAGIPGVAGVLGLSAKQ